MADEANNPGTPLPGDGGNTHYQTLDEFTRATGTLLTNAQLPDIAPLLDKRGYSAEIIRAKQQELEALRGLDAAQRREYGEQYDSTQAYGKAQDALHEDYRTYAGSRRRNARGVYF